MFGPFDHQANLAKAFAQADHGLTPVAARTILTGDTVWLLVALNLPSPNNADHETDAQEPNEDFEGFTFWQDQEADSLSTKPSLSPQGHS